MKELISSPAFWLGITVLWLNQWGRFAEFSSLSDVKSLRSPSVRIGLKPRDLTDSRTYHTALIVYLFVSALVYFLLCLIPEPIYEAIRELEGTSSSGGNRLDPQYFPLFVATGMIGVSQPIPFLEKLSNFQREVFHRWIGIPDRVESTAAIYAQKLISRSAPKDALDSEIRFLLGPAFQDSLARHGDFLFFKRHIEHVGLDQDHDVEALLTGSNREKSYVIQDLVLAACVAVVRKGGGTALNALERDLNIDDGEADKESHPLLLNELVAVILINFFICYSVFIVLRSSIFRDFLTSNLTISDHSSIPTSDIAVLQYISYNYIPFTIALISSLFVYRSHLAREEMEGGSALNILISNSKFYFILFAFFVIYYYVQALIDIANAIDPKYEYDNLQFFTGRILQFIQLSLVPTLFSYIISIIIINNRYINSFNKKTLLFILIFLLIGFFSTVITIFRIETQFLRNVEAMSDFLFIVVFVQLLAASSAYWLGVQILRKH